MVGVFSVWYSVAIGALSLLSSEKTGTLKGSALEIAMVRVQGEMVLVFAGNAMRVSLALNPDSC
jgi:hypothetical protein